MPEADEIADNAEDRDLGSAGRSRSTAVKPGARSSARRVKGKRRGERRQLPLWQEMIVLLCIALGLAILLKSLFVQLFYIPSASMNETLIRNDRIAVEKVSYWFDGRPERGDIVVFSDPGGWLPTHEARSGNLVTQTMEFFGLYPAGDHLVKRVIGVGGDRVRCCDRQGRLEVNGEPLDETAYLPASVRPSLQKFNVIVPDGRLWVMGDNRINSADSRAHLTFDDPDTPKVEKDEDPVLATIPEDRVVGRVFAIVWPLARATIEHRPEALEKLDDQVG